MIHAVIITHYYILDHLYTSRMFSLYLLAFLLLSVHDAYGKYIELMNRLNSKSRSMMGKNGRLAQEYNGKT